jgi:hypothetical protein
MHDHPGLSGRDDRRPRAGQRRDDRPDSAPPDAAGELVSQLEQIGPVLTELGQRAQTIGPTDTAARQQWASDQQQAAAPIAQLGQIALAPELQGAVQQIPQCQDLAGFGG